VVEDNDSTGAKIDDDDDVMGMYQTALFDLGLNPLQNLTEEQTKKKDINMRLSKMAKALPAWKTKFDKLCKWTDAKPPTQKSCKLLLHQRQPDTLGLRSKADFEALHSTEEWRQQWNSKNQVKLTGTEWRENHAKLKKLMKDKEWNIEV
jgi:hypothetical protein